MIELREYIWAQKNDAAHLANWAKDLRNGKPEQGRKAALWLLKHRLTR